LHCTGTQELASEYDAAKAQLEANDTYTQVSWAIKSHQWQVPWVPWNSPLKGCELVLIRPPKHNYVHVH